MVKSIGFDFEPETRRKRAFRFVILSWKDALLRTFEIKGRTSRAAFLVSIFPITLIWTGLFVVGMTRPAQKDKLFDSGFFIVVLCLPLLVAATLVFRRLHDTGNKAVGATTLLTYINPFSGLLWIAKLLKQGDNHENKYGPPHILIPKNSKENC